MLPRNKRGEKQQSTGRRNARATGRQREGKGVGGREVGRESAENLKTLTVFVLCG